MPVALEKKLPLILFFVFLMMGVFGYFAYRSNVALQNAVKWEKRTQETLLKLDDTLGAATDVETGGRGFVITGNEVFLEPYKTGRQKAREDLENLKTLVADNPKQNENFAALEKYVNDRIAVSDKIIELRRTDGLLGAVNETSKGEGKVAMDGVQAAVGKMKSEEFRLLALREENLQNTLSNNFWIMLFGSLAGTISLAVANFVVVVESGRRRQAEKDLREANKNLENRVEERTGELKKANLELLESADEKERLFQNEQTARHEAEVATRLRDEFMAAISHELRTPLNSILGWARILKGKTLDKTTSDKAVQTIIKNAEAQNRLIEDLLDVGRIVSGKLALEHENINFEELVKNAVETVKPSSDEKSISMDLKIDENLKQQNISGDPDRLRQIVWNLLTNAIKFTPEGGRIEVELSEENKFIVLRVTDTGVGISPEFLPFVFERFRQDSATIKKTDGLGLGLAIVRHLTEIQGGAVSVESDGENQGTTFTVRFPPVSPKEKSAEQAG